MKKYNQETETVTADVVAASTDFADFKSRVSSL